MKRNLDFFIILFICLFVSGVLYLLYDNTDKYVVSGSSSSVGLRGVGSNVHLQGGGSRLRKPSYVSDGGVQITMRDGVRGASSPSRLSVPSYSSVSGQSQGMNTYSPISSSLSISSSNGVRNGVVSGGGGSFGGSQIYRSTRPSDNVVVAPPLAYGGFSRPNISLPRTRQSMSRSASTDAGATVETEPMRQSVRRPFVSSSFNVPTAISSNYAYNSRGLSVYGNATSDFGTMKNPYRASAQHRAPPSISGGGEDTGEEGNDDESGSDASGSWGNWLDNNWNKNSFGGVLDGDNVWFTEDEARGIYDTMFGDNYWNEGMGDPPSWEDFLAWLRADGGKYHVPLGDTLPLVLIGLAYMLVVFVFKRQK